MKALYIGIAIAIIAIIVGAFLYYDMGSGITGRAEHHHRRVHFDDSHFDESALEIPN